MYGLLSASLYGLHLQIHAPIEPCSGVFMFRRLAEPNFFASKYNTSIHIPYDFYKKSDIKYIYIFFIRCLRTV